jgi:small subunit ribosomal protein S20
MAEQAKKNTRRPTALKRDIQNEKKRLLNKSFKSKVRTAMNSFDSAVQAQEKDRISLALNQVYSLMDKGVKRGVFKANKAARTKARFFKKVSA